MTAYADYAFYSGEYLGRVITSEKDFAYYALRASEIIDSKTFGRIDEITPAVKMACCAAADELYSDASAKAKAAGIASVNAYRIQVDYRLMKRASEQMKSSHTPSKGAASTQLQPTFVLSKHLSIPLSYRHLYLNQFIFSCSQSDFFCMFQTSFPIRIRVIDTEIIFCLYFLLNLFP